MVRVQQYVQAIAQVLARINVRKFAQDNVKVAVLENAKEHVLVAVASHAPMGVRMAARLVALLLVRALVLEVAQIAVAEVAREHVLVIAAQDVVADVLVVLLPVQIHAGLKHHRVVQIVRHNVAENATMNVHTTVGVSVTHRVVGSARGNAEEVAK